MTEHSHRVGAPYRVSSANAAEEFASNIQAALDQFGSAIRDALGLKADESAEKGVIDDEKILEQFSEVMDLKSETILQGDTIKMLRTQIRELERQLGESREDPAKRFAEEARDRLRRIRHELRYNPQITAQSHLNRVRRVAGVSRWS